jgi:hypothetical protein
MLPQSSPATTAPASSTNRPAQHGIAACGFLTEAIASTALSTRATYDAHDSGTPAGDHMPNVCEYGEGPDEQDDFIDLLMYPPGFPGYSGLGADVKAYCAKSNFPNAGGTATVTMPSGLSDDAVECAEVGEPGTGSHYEIYWSAGSARFDLELNSDSTLPAAAAENAARSMYG